MRGSLDQDAGRDHLSTSSAVRPVLTHGVGDRCGGGGGDSFSLRASVGRLQIRLTRQRRKESLKHQSVHQLDKRF